MNLLNGLYLHFCGNSLDPGRVTEIAASAEATCADSINFFPCKRVIYCKCCRKYITSSGWVHLYLRLNGDGDGLFLPKNLCPGVPFSEDQQRK